MPSKNVSILPPKRKTKMFDERCKTSKLRLIVCALITPLFFISSGIVLIITRTIMYDGIKGELTTLRPGSKTFDLFKKTPFDVYLDIYFFNWTNPEEFNNPTVKPKFEEIGPFRFLEVMEKTNITFHENSTVSYNRTRKWYFKKELSSPYDLNTPITSINPVAASGGYAMRHESSWTKKLFSIGLRSILGKMDMTQSVANLFWEGYEDALINLGQTLPFVKHKVPPMDKFGWFYKRNGSNVWDGRYNMGTGCDKVFGQLYEYNNMKHSQFYKDVCGDFRGSAGEFFPSSLKKEVIEIFNPEMCRTITLDYVGESRKKMMNGYKFTMGDHFFDNGTIYPENTCYCTGECVPYGAMNISLCRYGAPGFVSLPHFYKADPYYTNLVDGMKPSERHDFFMIIEPTTGIPLEVSARLQINLLVKNVPGIGLLEDREDTFFPIFWFEQVVEIPTKYSIGLFFFLWLKEFCIFTGLLMIFTGVFVMSLTIYRYCTTPLWTRPNEICNNKELVPLSQDKR